MNPLVVTDETPKGEEEYIITTHTQHTPMSGVKFTLGGCHSPWGTAPPVTATFEN